MSLFRKPKKPTPTLAFGQVWRYRSGTQMMTVMLTHCSPSGGWCSIYLQPSYSDPTLSLDLPWSGLTNDWINHRSWERLDD